MPDRYATKSVKELRKILQDREVIILLFDAKRIVVATLLIYLNAFAAGRLLGMFGKKGPRAKDQTDERRVHQKVAQKT